MKNNEQSSDSGSNLPPERIKYLKALIVNSRDSGYKIDDADLRALTSEEAKALEALIEERKRHKIQNLSD